MDIAKAAETGDMTIEIDGLRLFLEPRASGMLTNTTIDFRDGQGFVLAGTQQSSCGSCSC